MATAATEALAHPDRAGGCLVVVRNDHNTITIKFYD